MFNMSFFHKKIFILIPVIVVIACLGLILIGSGVLKKLNYEEKLHPRTEIAGVNLGEFEYEAAYQTLVDKTEELNKRKVLFDYNENTYKFTFKELGVNWFIEDTIEKALKHEKSLEDRMKFLFFSTVSEKIEMPLFYEIDLNTLENNIQDLEEKIDLEPEDAEFNVDFETREVTLASHKKGQKLDIISLKDTLQGFTNKASKDIEEIKGQKNINLKLPVKTTEPDYTTEKLDSFNINTIISTFKTSFSKDNESRVNNIELAANELNKIIIEPGEKIAFNKKVGPITYEEGYEDASVIIDGEFVDGIGGGICQVSSTLYNSALLAGLKPIERYAHSRPVGYVSLGRDATVAYDYLDLRLQNNHDHHVLVISWVKDDTIIFDFYGKELKYDYQIETRNYEEIEYDEVFYYETNHEEQVEVSFEEAKEIIIEDLKDQDLDNVTENNNANDANNDVDNDTSGESDETEENNLEDNSEDEYNEGEHVNNDVDLEEDLNNREDRENNKMQENDLTKDELEDLVYEKAEVVQEGSLGYKIEVWLVKKSDGVNIDNKLISQDKYQPVDQEYLINLD